MTVSAQKRFNDVVTERLRSRYASNVCISLECISCGSYYVPNAQTANGLCEFCLAAIDPTA